MLDAIKDTSFIHPARILLVGNRDGTNIAGSFERAAIRKGLAVRVIESRLASPGPRFYRSLIARLRGNKPSAIGWFSEHIAAVCADWRPQVLLTMGRAPVLDRALEQIGALGVIRCNYSTDDPWNPEFPAQWYLESLNSYDHVFTTRQANIVDFQQFPNPAISYLPFGYAPEHFFPPVLSPQDRILHECDVLFAGFGDRDRVPYIAALLSSGLRVSLYGTGWEKFPATRKVTRGQADIETLRLATAAARTVLCLVRRANRDGHSMRSFEVPAVGGCMLAERTEEHADLFGNDGLNVVYFATPDELAIRARQLVDDPISRARMATNAHELITKSDNTYESRLEQILDIFSHPSINAITRTDRNGRQAPLLT